MKSNTSVASAYEALAPLVPSAPPAARITNGEVDVALGESSRIVFSELNSKEISGQISLDLGDGLFADPKQVTHRAVEIARAALRGGFTMVRVYRMDDGDGACVPDLQIAGLREPIVCTACKVIEQVYDDVDAFLAGWTVEEIGARLVLTRALDAVTRAELLRETQDHQWAMARVAKPGATKYWGVDLVDGEEPIFRAKPSLLKLAGVVGTMAEFAANVMKPGEHLPGHDILMLREVIRARRLRTGEPIASVRVAFINEESARRERRPLLDVGAKVIFQRGADDIEVTD